MIKKIWRFTSGLLIFSILAQFIVFSPQPAKAAADIAIFGAALIDQNTVRVSLNPYASYSQATCDASTLSKFHLRVRGAGDGNPITYFTPTDCVPNPSDQLQVLLTFSDPVTNVTGFPSGESWTIFFDEGAIYDLSAPTTVSAAVAEGSAKTVFDLATPDAISYSIASNNTSTTLARVSGGDTITVTFTATEEIRTDSITVQIAGVNADSIINTMGNTWAASRQVGLSGAETNGLVTFSIQADDAAFFSNYAYLASNVTAGSDGSLAVIDAPPVVTGESITGPNEITITYSEPVSTSIGDYTDLNLTAGGARTVTSISGSGTQTILLNFSGAPVAADETGTIDIGTGVADLDDVPDSLVLLNDSMLTDGQIPSFTLVHISSNNASTTLAKPLDTVTITLTANEPITADAASYSIDGLSASSFSLDGQTITMTRVLDFGDTPGFVGFSLSNIYTPSYSQAASTVTSTTDGSQVYLDMSAPIISASAFTGPHELTVIFTEPLTSPVTTDAITTVTADAVEHAVTAVSQISASEYAFTLDGAAIGLNATGSVTFNDLFSITDAAGNTTNPLGTNGVSDAQSPSITPVTLSSNNTSSTVAKVGNTVTLQFTNDGATGTPTVTIAGNSVTPVNTSGNDWTATYLLTAEDTAGAVDFSISAVDDYANSRSVTTATNGLGVTFDKTAPDAPVITTTAQTTSNSSITITGTAETGANITISGGSSIASGTATGGNFSVAVNLTADSVNTLSVTASDAAGNISATSTVAITHQTASTPPTSSGGGGGGGGGMPISSVPTSPVTVPTLPVTENTLVLGLNTPVTLSVGGASYTVTVLTASNQRVTFVIQSEPKTVTVKLGEVVLVDTDNDGVADVRAEYLGLVNGQPKLSLSNLTDTNETQKIFTINSGAYQTTDSNVMIKLNQTNAVSWAVSNSPDFKDVVFETYRGPKKWSLTPSFGTKTVYVKVLLSGGAIVSASDTITLVATTASTELPVIEVPPTTPTVVSTITFANEKNKTVAPGKSIAYVYRYKNTTPKSANVTVVRELVNGQNEVLESAKLKLKLRSGETFSRNVSQLVSKKLLSDTYSIRIKVLDSRGIQIDTNEFAFTIVAQKQKVFSLSSGEAANDLVFDQTLVAKYEVPKVLSTPINLGYSYTNTSGAVQHLKAVRQLVNAEGKVIASAPGGWVLKPGESFGRKFVQNIPANLLPGEYSIRVAAYDKVTNSLVVENKLLLTISEK